jgi:hypothetical protein
MPGVLAIVWNESKSFAIPTICCFDVVLCDVLPDAIEIALDELA